MNKDDFINHLRMIERIEEISPLIAAKRTWARGEECGCPIVPEGPSILNTPGCSGTYLFMMYVQSYLWGRCDISTPCDRIVSTREPIDSVDYIVVGAGTAGSIVAGRLSEDSGNSVLLIEAGGEAPLGSRIPSFYPMFWGHEKVDWRYRTELGNFCLNQGDKGCSWPRGKALGGTSLLNGMIYHKGHKLDYDKWVEMGATGWSWDELQPYFDMTEGNKQICERVSGKYHSDSGPLPVQTFNYQPPEAHALLQAAKEAGFPVIDDMNDPDTPNGFTFVQANNFNGQRYTTARAYLKPESVRPNLKVLLNSHVTKVIFDGKRAVGVKYIDSKGNTRTVRARKEVILSGGALNSPQILMLSGVGPRKHLRKMGIPVIANLPVGQNLRTHVGVLLYFTLTKMNKTQSLDWSALTEYLQTRGGPMSSTGLTQVTGLLSTSMAVEGQPDIQYFFDGFQARCSKTGETGEPLGCGGPGYNITAYVILQLPYSVGHLDLRSTNPLDSPRFYPNFFDHPADIARIKEGIQFFKRMYESRILQEEYGITFDPEYTDMCAHAGEEWSDSWSECMITVSTDPHNHQHGTTAIGRVLDPELSVHGVKNLRVCDAGAMPTLTSGNPQAAIMAIAEKCAVLIKETWA